VSDIAVAESVWETALKRNIFIYDPNSKFKINLIYDQRQLATLQKEKQESGLEALENALKTLDAQLSAEKKDFESKLTVQNAAVAQFESRQKKYEAMVEYWNSQGGAPKKEYESMQSEQRSLNDEAAALNASAAKLNAIAKDLNALIEKRNNAAREYNKTAENYNDAYGHGLEFNQAEFTGAAINVYQFGNERDLTLALAHELGHALGMDHVENPKSIMYYVTSSNTSTALAATPEDLIELTRVCPDASSRGADLLRRLKTGFSLEKILPKK